MTRSALPTTRYALLCESCCHPCVKKERADANASSSVPSCRPAMRAGGARRVQVGCGDNGVGCESLMRCVVRGRAVGRDTATGHDATATEFAQLGNRPGPVANSYWIGPVSVPPGSALALAACERVDIVLCTGARLFRLENWTVVVRGRAMGRARLPCVQKRPRATIRSNTYCGRVTHSQLFERSVYFVFDN